MTSAASSSDRLVDSAKVERLTTLIRSTGATTRATFSPLDGSPLAELPVSTADDVASAFDRARAVQQSWSRTPVRSRAAAMLRFHDLLLDHLDELCDLLCVESGKARKDAFDEVIHLALTARYLGRTLSRHLASERRLGVFPVATSVRLNRVPEGVVAVISPWNYPLTMAFCDGLAALGAGNAVVAKPDSQTMLVALRGLELLESAGFPADVWQIVSGPGPVIGTALIEQADHVCFTGSTATGRLVAAQAGRRLIATSLELGGKNPMVVLADADIEAAVDGAVRGCFSNAGQLCVSFERLYVAREIYPEFKREFIRQVESLDLAAGSTWASDVGTLVSADQLRKVSEHVEDARALGADVLAGGRPRPDLAPYAFEPTLLEGVTPGMACYSEETFGPVASLYEFATNGEAIALANLGQEGLNAAVYGRNVRRAQKIAAGIRCGTVTVNEVFGAALGSIDAPMGGMGTSGVGRRQGREGVLRFTEPQAVATQRFISLGGLPGMSRERWSQTMVTMLRLLRWTPRP